jgi:hypothetical protein
MSKIQRQRNNVRLTETANLRVRAQLSQKGWTQFDWCCFGSASLSTVKRLLAGKAIDPGVFVILIQELGLELEEACLIRNISMPATIEAVAEISSTRVLSTNYQRGVFMTGRYSQDNKAKIERVLEHLRGLMVDAEFCFEEKEGAIMVSGSFSEENMPQIEMSIKRLESLLTASTVTW